MNPTPAALLNHLWQSGVAGIAVLALLFLGRGLAARTRRALAWIGLIQLALPVAPLLAWLAARLSRAKPPPTPPLLPAEWLHPVVVAASVPSRHPQLWPWVGLAWAAGFAGLFGLWLLRGWRFRRALLATATPPEEATAVAVAGSARRLGLRRPPACREAGSDFGPGVLGWIRPVVILPRSLQAQLTPAEFDAIVIHELIHVRRRDAFLGLLQALLLSAFWFNPVAWLLHRTLREETERSCDDSVLAVTADPESYANGILKALRHSLGAAAPGFAGALTLPLAARLKAILAPERRPERRLWRCAALAAGLACAAFSGRAGLVTLDETPLQLAATAHAPIAATTARGTPSIPAAASPAPASVAAIPQTAPARAAGPRAPSLPSAATAGAAPSHPSQAKWVVLTPVHVSPDEVDAAPPSPVPAHAHPPASYNPRDLDQQPRPLSQPRPHYPYDLKKQGYMGDVALEFLIYPDGSVHAPKVLRSTQAGFNDAALEAVSQWRFNPGRRGGRAVITRTQVTIEFRMFHEGP